MLDPKTQFERLEEKLLNAESVSFGFHVTAEGVLSVEIRGEVELSNGGPVLVRAGGEFAGQPVELNLKAEGDRLVLTNAPAAADQVRPPALEEAILIGFTRMGILHNLARLTGTGAPDHSEGGVDEWVTVAGFRQDEANALATTFDISVAGAPAGFATLEMDAAGLPVARHQTVQFPSGEMRVTERYTDVAIAR